MNYDVSFTVNSGDHKTDTYRYILSLVNGKKAWSLTPLFYPPPSMIKNKIDMTIAAREHNVSKSGATELMTVSKMLNELSIIAEADEPATLTGLDKEKRLIRIDKNGFTITSAVNEKGKEPEYQINLTCWGLYDY